MVGRQSQGLAQPDDGLLAVPIAADATARLVGRGDPTQAGAP